jgi:tRNA modification GTPase
MSLSRTTARRLTSSEPAAIAVIEIQGPSAQSLVARFWKPAGPQAVLEINRIRFGNWQSLNSSVGEQVVVCRTQDECIEIHCHGGQQAAGRIIADLEASGAVVGLDRSAASAIDCDALSEETIRRAAQEDLVRAKTEKTAGILLDQWRGALSREVRMIRNLQATGQFDEASKRIKALKSSYAIGRHLVVPYQVVVAGPPNVGKSSLINAILGYSRVIVHETAGTTRDVIAELTSVDGWPVLIHDTAGFRDSRDEIEQQGISAARLEVDAADLVLVLVDESQGWTPVQQGIYSASLGKNLIVGSKHDLRIDADELGCQIEVSTTAITSEGIDRLLDQIARRIYPVAMQPDQAVVFRAEQREAIDRIASS